MPNIDAFLEPEGWQPPATIAATDVLTLAANPDRPAAGLLAPSEQLELRLSIEPLVRPTPVKGATNQERFEAFHAANPWVFTALETLAADYLRRGRKRVGISMLYEVLRWHHGRQTATDEPFKLSNSFQPWYSRALTAKHPDWADLFGQRTMWVP